MSLDPDECSGILISNMVYVPPAMRNEMEGYKPPWIDQIAKHQNGGPMDLARVPDGWSPDTMISAASAIRGKYQPSIRPGWRHISAEQHRKYHYMPISDCGETRMLCLLPGRKEDPILARIDTCSLDNPPSYKAISYAWGDPYLNSLIAVRDWNSDYWLSAPQNLYKALARLRHHLKTRYIWADAVCINQENEDENSQQVQLMPLIHRRATRVLIWLGDESLNGKAGALFNLMSRMYFRDFKTVPPLDDKETWSNLKDLFTRQWFWRVWCLQEAVLAPSAEVILGKHSIPWEHVGFMATWIRCMPFGLFQQDSALIGVYNACLTYSLSHGYKNQQRISILQLLTLTRAFRATDPRDKIYGIQGIPTVQSDTDVGNVFMQSDYTKTISEVYINCASSIINHTQSLQLLSYVQHSTIEEWSTGYCCSDEDDTLNEVPSWVPRWHHYFSRTLAPAEQETQTFRPSASLGSESVGNTMVKGLTVTTSGMQFSLVETASTVFSNLHTASVNLQDTANDIFTEFEKPLRNLGVELKEMLYTLSFTLTSGKNWFGSVVEDREQHFADFLAFLDNKPCLDHLNVGEIAERERYLTQRPNRLKELLHQLRIGIASPLSNKSGQAHRFGEAMRSACTFRRAILTETDHVGLGPMAVMPGDVVCILKDAVMPMVLRPVDGGNSFKVVGESYVHGIMFGEVGKDPAISRPLEQIVLSDKPFVEPTEIMHHENGRGSGASRSIEQ